MTLAERLDALLPQTQCRRCGHKGCRPYAEAIAAGTADINQCPPGGEPTIAALAALLARAPKPLDTERGVYKPPQLARIDEAACIGCTLCLQACPVDAILGAAKQMHTVIQAECTGCELCLPPCPVDCIELRPAPSLMPAPTRAKADLARQRFQARERRLRDQSTRRANRKPAVSILRPETLTDEAKQAVIAAAIARAKTKHKQAAQRARQIEPELTDHGAD